MNRKRWTLAALAAVMAGAPAVTLLAQRQDRAKADVPLDQVPRAVLDAAEKEAPGIALDEAKRRDKKSGIIYKLEGTAGGREYEFKIDARGNVLDVEVDDEDDAGPKASRQVRAARTVPTTRDATCATRSAKAAPPRPAGDSPAAQVGWLKHAAIRESSGIAASRTNPGVYWTHNDKGNAPTLYAIAEDGTLLGEYPVAAANDDWEDVAADDGGNLYVGNIGNNKAKRDWLEVHRLPEPRVAAGPEAAAGPGPSLSPTKTWRLKFPGRPFDCESLVVHGAHAYVVSKLFNGEPASLYRFALDGPAEAVLEKVADLPVRSAVTAADLSPQGRLLAVLAGDGLHLITVDEGLRPAAGLPPQVIPVPAGKLEGVCFTRNGLLLTAESREVYRLPQQ